MDIHIVIKPVTEWLAIWAVIVFVAGIVLFYATASRLELGAVGFMGVGTVVAAILLILAVGSML